MKENMVSTEIQIAKNLDLKGLLCPIPVVKISKAIKNDLTKRGI